MKNTEIKNTSGEKTDDIELKTLSSVDNLQDENAVKNRYVSKSDVKIFNPTQYYNDGFFYNTLSEFQINSERKTGYENLDSIQGFYPGFYVLGAISSLGKTTFCHQMADQLAKLGETVLYFSLEQNFFELFSKSLSRSFYCSWLEDKKSPLFSSIDIRRGIPQKSHSEIFDKRISDYVDSVGDNFQVAECNFSATVEDILKVVENHMSETRKKPIVFIDYLQIISPTLVNGYPSNAKNNIDHIVHSLKCFQSLHNLVVVVISSLNRQNYITPIDFESFKESGGIEYTADVFWGLQLTAINDEIFSKEGKIKEKREIIRKAKSMNPRRVQLVCIKNRYGVSNYTVEFEYFPAYDVFVSTSKNGDV